MSHECCEGVRGLRFSRRYFLKQGGIALVGMSAMPAFLQRAAAATAMPNKKQLVVLFQRGAADGLNIVVPFSEANYYRMRPSIWMVISGCIRALRRWRRCFEMSSWRSYTRRVRRIRRDHILMRRTSWNRERRA